MKTDPEDSESEALKLTEAERTHLLPNQSQTPERIKNAWVRESDDRLEAFRNGEIEAVDGPQAMAELRSRFCQ